MSMDALLQASANTLRTNIGAVYNAAGNPNFPGDGTGGPLNRQQCDVQYQGRPPQSMGQWYISLWESNVESNERTLLKESMAFDVFITVRTGVLPKDRWGTTQMGFLGTWSITSLTALERAIIRALHGSQSLRIATNLVLSGLSAVNLTITSGDGILLDGTAGGGFTIPPYYLGRSETYDEDGSWIGALPGKAASPEKAAFLVKRLKFGGALRPQAIPIMQ